MTRNDIFETVREMVVQQLSVDAERVTGEAAFEEDLQADSLDTVELIMGLEEKFGLEIADDEAKGLRTVGDAVQYVSTQVGASA